ncbi:hypothetical protein L1987_47678 [Smallanthus sonchifolius]|uniref:Uncharacterized protein n=1 Tax=Smallanthus sonchifolius TaxID=185202 RepID=A0ACB9G469_9ASTR|nr:hypothetical protein L1987_47678 [Smallanthus sonchifolius]
MGNENRDIAPVILKFGVALALSFGGVLYSLIINKRSKASRSPNDCRKRLDCNKQANSRSNHLSFDPLATYKHEELHNSNNTEFVRANSESPKGYSCAEKVTHEQEIKSLRNTVKVLKERESNLEIKLLEYYGLKEQETVVMELQNRLKLSNMEARFFALKSESLQADNRRLEAQMTDYKKVVVDLEAARTKIKMLKKKLKSEAEQNKKQILDFHQRVQKMQDDENKHVADIDPEIEPELHKLKDLEAEVAELRKSNHDLQLEKDDLAHRLDCVQILATSVLEDAECQKVKEENQNLKKQNEDLSKEIERLQADRCGDVEQLVYLRWINACLRYELRNYQPGLGKTTARDLSKNLSPKSEEKAEQLILEYADKEGVINVPEIDSDQWSTSQASIVTDDHKSNKFFGKLIRILRGKDKDSRNSSRGGEDMCNSCWSPENQKLTHRHSDSSFYNQIDSIAKEDGGDGGGGGGRGHSRQSYSSLGGQKAELAKYAEALNDSRPASNFKSHRRSSSLTFF